MELIVFISGLILGSFASSVLYRMEDLRSIVNQRSHCKSCKKVLKWYDLIPLLSFVLLGGRCRSCGEKISWEYPLLELVTAIIFTLIYMYIGLSFVSVCLMLICLGLVIIFDYDIKNQIIPDVILFPILILWIVYLIVGFLLGSEFVNSSQILDSVYGALVGGIFLWFLVFITKGRGMGFGDVKLMTVLGLIIGLKGSIVILFFSFVIGAIYSLFLLLQKKSNLKTKVAFGPFLVIGFFIAFFYAERIINWYIY